MQMIRDSGEDSQTDRAREWFALHRIKSVSNFFCHRGKAIEASLDPI